MYIESSGECRSEGRRGFNRGIGQFEREEGQEQIKRRRGVQTRAINTGQGGGQRNKEDRVKERERRVSQGKGQVKRRRTGRMPRRGEGVSIKEKERVLEGKRKRNYQEEEEGLRERVSIKRKCKY